jgi:heat shock protein HslJ
MKKIVILLSLTFLLVLAACSEEATPTPEPTQEPEVAEPTEAPAEEPEPTEAPAEEPEPTEAPAEEPTTAPEPAAEEPAEMAVDSELAGIRWHCEEFQDTADLNSFAVPKPRDYTILFNPDGTAEIKADCNNVLATYTTDGSSSLSLQMGPSTMVFCGEESLDQVYLRSLEEVVSYVMADGILHMNLIMDAGNMVFGRGPLDILPEQISLDTQDLPYSWQAVVVPPTPYDESMPPGPKGLPEHIEILFGVTDPADRQPNDPIMYIIPANAYRAMWEEAGSSYVTDTMAAIEQIAFNMNRPDSLGLPTLPTEEIAGVNDLAVQLGRAVPAGQVNETSATQTGYRFVGRWMQDANPVTNQNLRYVYQGFTNDGKYLVSYWHPVRSSQIPDDPSQVSDEAMNQFNSDVEAYLAAEAERLNALSTSDWEPDLATLDAVVASLEIEDMVSAGLQQKTWLWVEGPEQPGSSNIVQIENPTLYQVTYGTDGIVNIIADCNLASFPYDLNWTGMQGGMLVQPGPVTLAQCAPGSLSDSFFNSIQASQSYRVRTGGNFMELVLPAGGGVLTLVDIATYEASVDLPEPESGEPTATVTSAVGANVRTGPGSTYPIIGVAPAGSSGRVVGISEDGAWWAIFIPGAPNNIGWVNSSVVQVENVDNVPVFAAPPPPAQPTPVPSPTPTPVPSTDITFEASRTSINAGETSLLTWSVENVTAVYMFPVGGNYLNYPTTGQGSKEVQPGITTTYVLLVINRDGSTSSESIEISVLNGLTASRWLLQSYSSPETGYRTVIPGSEITARFEANGNLSGSAGCNTYNGGFTAYDQVLQTSNLGLSQALCDSPQGVMDQEATYMRLLGQSARFNVSAGQLSVFDSAGNRILVYIAG